MYDLRHSLLVPILLMLGALNTGCTNLQPAQAPAWTRSGVHFSGGTVLAFNRDGSQMASGGYNGDIAILDMPSGKQTYKDYHHSSAVRGLAWADDDHLISGAEDGQLRVWDTRRKKVIHTITSTPITAMAYLPIYKVIVTGHSEGKLIAWRYPSLKQLASQHVQGRVNALASSRDQKSLAIATEKGVVALSDFSLRKIQALQSPPKAIKALSFHKDGKRLRGGAWFKVYEWNVETNAFREIQTEHAGEVTSLEFSPDGRSMISLGRWTDSAIRLTDTKTGKIIRRLKAHEWCGAAVRFSPDGRYIVSTSDDESIRLYDLQAPYRPK